MGTTITEKQQIMKGDSFRIIFLVKGAKLEGGHPTEVTSRVEGDIREFVSAHYEMKVSISDLLGIKVKKDFVPDEKQFETIMSRITDWFAPLCNKTDEAVRFSFDNSTSFVIVSIDNKTENGLVWQDILDAVK